MCAVGAVATASALWRQGLVRAQVVNTPEHAHFYVRLDDEHGQWVLDVTATQFTSWPFGGQVPAHVCVAWEIANVYWYWRTIWRVWRSEDLHELVDVTRRWSGGRGAVGTQDVARARLALAHGKERA